MTNPIIKIFQFSYESSEAHDGVGSITYKVSGDKQTMEEAEYLWTATKDLSNAEFSSTPTIEYLKNEGYSEEEITKLFTVFPNSVSEDIITAYAQCLLKFKKIGLEIEFIYNDEDIEADVWVGYGVH